MRAIYIIGSPGFRSNFKVLYYQKKQKKGCCCGSACEETCFVIIYEGAMRQVVCAYILRKYGYHKDSLQPVDSFMFHHSQYKLYIWDQETQT